MKVFSGNLKSTQYQDINVSSEQVAGETIKTLVSRSAQTGTHLGHFNNLLPAAQSAVTGEWSLLSRAASSSHAVHCPLLLIIYPFTIVAALVHY